MNWVKVTQAPEIVRLKLHTLYVYAAEDAKINRTDRFVKKDGRLYVNIDAIKSLKVTNEMQMEFERLYFILDERHKRKVHFYKKIASVMNKKQQCIASALTNRFLNGTEETKLKYIKAMKIVIEKGLNR